MKKLCAMIMDNETEVIKGEAIGMGLVLVICVTIGLVLEAVMPGCSCWRYTYGLPCWCYLEAMMLNVFGVWFVTILMWLLVIGIADFVND